MSDRIHEWDIVLHRDGDVSRRDKPGWPIGAWDYKPSGRGFTAASLAEQVEREFKRQRDVRQFFADACNRSAR